MPPARKSGALQGVVFLTIFLDLLGFGLIIPIQPFYAESLGSLGRVVGPAVAGPLFAVTRDLPFWLAGVGLLLALALARDAALGQPMRDDPAAAEE